MAPADGNFDPSDLSDWAERTGGEEPGVSLSGLDEPAPGAEDEEEEGDGEGEEAADPCEALRGAQKSLDDLESIELDEDADPKLVKRLDSLRDDAEDLAKEAGELADDVEADEKERQEKAEDEEDDEDDEKGDDEEEDDEPAGDEEEDDED